MIAVELLFYECPLDELVVKQQYPTMILTSRAVILLATYLTWGESYQRTVAFMIGADAISQALREFLLQENTISVDSVQRVAYLTHLVIVYHRDVGMIDRRTYVMCVVIRFVDIQVYRHCRFKDTNFLRYNLSFP